MAIKEQLQKELKDAMKNTDTFTVGVLRMILASLHTKEIEKRGAGKEEVLSTQEELDVLKREAKKRKESITLYESAGRNDLRDIEAKELVLIERYLPEAVSPEKIREVVQKIVATGEKDFGRIMKQTMRELKGEADGGIVSGIVKSLLQ